MSLGRFGAILRSIPVQNRVGDYVHANSRVWNILVKRLLGEFDNPRDAADIKEVAGLRPIAGHSEASFLPVLIAGCQSFLCFSG